jgi:relaxin family peptide receptor 2
LRYALWFMAFLTCVGNISVLWGRFRDENRSVSLVIRNLAFSDMIMGVYLIIIGYKDTLYRDVYHENSAKWITSWECAFTGILAMTSAEVSIFILTFMSIERFLLISDPFGHHKLDTKFVMLSLYAIWLIGVSIAILPVILFRSSTKFYGVYNGATCFPLFIEEVYPTGWIYSAFVFLGINFPLLFSIFRTRRATSLNFIDCEFAIRYNFKQNFIAVVNSRNAFAKEKLISKCLYVHINYVTQDEIPLHRFFFIVLTDVSCWLPIIILKFMAFYDVQVSGDLYSWLVIFVLPLNSAVNPLLFTYTTPKYRDQIFATFTKQSLKKQDLNSNQITADESQTTKVSLLYNSNGSISKWKIFSK